MSRRFIIDDDWTNRAIMERVKPLINRPSIKSLENGENLEKEIGILCNELSNLEIYVQGLEEFIGQIIDQIDENPGVFS